MHFGLQANGGGAIAPRPPLATLLPPSIIRWNYSTLLYLAHDYQFRHFRILTIGLSPLLEGVSSQCFLET